MPLPSRLSGVASVLVYVLIYVVAPAVLLTGGTILLVEWCFG